MLYTSLNDGLSSGRTAGHSLPVRESSFKFGSTSPLEVVVRFGPLPRLDERLCSTSQGPFAPWLFGSWLLFCSVFSFIVFVLDKSFSNSFSDIVSGPWIL